MKASLLWATTPLYILGSIATTTASQVHAKETKSNRPNILFVISDDQSYPYASAYGVARPLTPAFDQVAQRGALFTKAFVTSPGSSPSRASILTGRYTWQIESAGTHNSTFPTKYVTFTDLLEDAGYHVGYTGKGWSPGNWKASGRKHNPAGKEYNKLKLVPPYKGIHKYDYFANFQAFMDSKPSDAPFFFWLGSKEAHRGYEKDSWKKEKMQLSDATVPACLPNVDAIRGDVLDAAVEIEWYDKQLRKTLDYLEKNGQLDNTLIIVTSDNGMPFPAAKANCFDQGIHVPLAICWGNQIQQSKVNDPFVSMVDIAPTILEAAQVSHKQLKHPLEGHSMLPWLLGKEKNTNNTIFAARERHTQARQNDIGYPIRVVRQENWLYIYNFTPEEWPAGAPWQVVTKNGETKKVFGFADIDWSPSKDYLLKHADEPAITPYYRHATAKRPKAELYDLETDPGCMCNLAIDARYVTQTKKMHKILFDKLRDTGDTRLTTPEVWDKYPHQNRGRQFLDE